MIVPILAVKSVDASVKFYSEKLGFKTDLIFAGPDGVNSFAGMSLGTSSIMFGNPPEGQEAGLGKGIDFMIYLPEDGDIDAVYADVQAKGLAIKTDLKTEYWGDRVFSVVDPDGYNLTIAKTVHMPDIEHVAKVFSGEVEA